VKVKKIQIYPANCDSRTNFLRLCWHRDGEKDGNDGRDNKKVEELHVGLFD